MALVNTTPRSPLTTPIRRFHSNTILSSQTQHPRPGYSRDSTAIGPTNPTLSFGSRGGQRGLRKKQLQFLRDVAFELFRLYTQRGSVMSQQTAKTTHYEARG